MTFSQHLAPFLQSLSQDRLGLGPSADLHVEQSKIVRGDQAPLTVFTDLTITPGSVRVESPDAVSVNEAVAQLFSGAGDSYRSRWNFVAEEITSVKQGSLALGLNAGHAERASAAVAFDESRSVSKRVFVGRALEEMFVVRFADDAVTTPAQLFGDSVTAVIRGEEASQNFGAALQTMFEGVEGGASVGGSDGELLSNATYHAQGYGPNAGDALGALQEAKLEHFFSPTTADKAVPLYFEIVTVKDPPS